MTNTTTSCKITLSYRLDGLMKGPSLICQANHAVTINEVQLDACTVMITSMMFVCTTGGTARTQTATRVSRSTWDQELTRQCQSAIL